MFFLVSRENMLDFYDRKSDKPEIKSIHINIFIAIDNKLTDQNCQAEQVGIQHPLFWEVMTCLCIYFSNTTFCFD